MPSLPWPRGRGRSRVHLGLLVLAVSALGAACASPPKPYNITLSDVDAAVEQLMDRLESSSLLTEVRASGTRPGIAIDLITNETDQRVSTERILQTFETRVVNMRTFEVVSYQNAERFKKALAEQQLDWFDQQTVPEAGKLFGFRYIIGGKLFGETERTGRSSRTEYRLILKVMDVERGVIEWSGDFDIYKAR